MEGVRRHKRLTVSVCSAMLLVRHVKALRSSFLTSRRISEHLEELTQELTITSRAMTLQGQATDNQQKCHNTFKSSAE